MVNFFYVFNFIEHKNACVCLKLSFYLLVLPARSLHFNNKFLTRENNMRTLFKHETFGSYSHSYYNVEIDQSYESKFQTQVFASRISLFALRGVTQETLARSSHYIDISTL